MQEKLERVQSLLQSMGLANTLATFYKELPGLEQSLKHLDGRHAPGSLSISSRAMHDLDSSNPFGAAMHVEPHAPSPNVFSDDARSNPFADGFDADDVFSAEQPRSQKYARSDLDRKGQYFSGRAPVTDFSDSGSASPNLSENAPKPSALGLGARKAGLDATKTPTPKAKFPFEPNLGLNKKYSANDFDAIDPHNLSFNIEGKSQSIDDNHHFDSECPVPPFSFCETIQGIDSHSQKTLSPLLHLSPNTHSRDYSRLLDEQQGFRGTETAEFSRLGPQPTASPTVQPPSSQRRIRDSFSPSANSHSGTTGPRQFDPPSRGSGVPLSSDALSVRSSKSVSFSRPAFEDEHIAVHSVTELEMKAFVDYLKASVCYLFKAQEPAELAQWDAPRPLRPDPPRRRSDNVSVKVFLFREEKKNMIRERYQITKELRQSASGAVLLCTNVKHGTSCVVKKVRDERRAFLQGLNEVFVLNQLREAGEPDRHCFVAVTEFFYFNVR